ncbi:MAG: PHP domain-containing protein [Clostridiales bacterium]|nr:PHP domain-containing protein [Clostridiales bacterium]
MKVDLHLHSTASDGTLAPGALVRRAAEEGFTMLALTDHDNVDGIGEAQAAAQEAGIRLVPGVELSCGAQKEIHILGYGIDTQNGPLLAFSRHRREEREARARKMVERLAQAGMTVSLSRVHELARGVVARPHVARALVEAGYASSVSDAFDHFLVPGKCGYVPKEEVRVAQAVALIHGAGGVAVLAHPMQLKLGDMALDALVCEWKGQGLDGLEVYHPSAQNNHAAMLLRLARREGMLVTGGSDFHGEAVRESRIGEGVERWTDAESDVAALLARILKD